MVKIPITIRMQRARFSCLPRAACARLPREEVSLWESARISSGADMVALWLASYGTACLGNRAGAYRQENTPPHHTAGRTDCNFFPGGRRLHPRLRVTS